MTYPKTIKNQIYDWILSHGEYDSYFKYAGGAKRIVFSQFTGEKPGHSYTIFDYKGLTYGIHWTKTGFIIGKGQLSSLMIGTTGLAGFGWNFSRDTSLELNEYDYKFFLSYVGAGSPKRKILKYQLEFNLYA